MAHAIRVMQGLNGDGDSVSLTRTNKARVIAGNRTGPKEKWGTVEKL